MLTEIKTALFNLLKCLRNPKVTDFLLDSLGKIVVGVAIYCVRKLL